MGAARLLLSSYRYRYVALASIVASRIPSLGRGQQRTYYDGPPPSPSWAKGGEPLVPKARTPNYASEYRSENVTPTDSPSPSKDSDREDDPGFAADDDSAWANFSRNFSAVRQGFATFEWADIGESITRFMLPPWARQIPDLVQKLQFELTMEPGTLADEIWQEAQDPIINPEILMDATVRISQDLCPEERAFLSKRKQHVVRALARYLDINESEIDPEDVPTIAICGSGGGLRALVAGTGSYLSAQEAGLFDCVTYTAGVSGSCWLQALFHTSIVGRNHENLVKHLKNRIGIHIAFPPAFLKLVTSAPTNKYLLSGFLEKLKGDPGADFGLVDIYGILLAARLMVPNGELGIDDRDLKLSNQRTYIDDGSNPLPIYTAVRHEIPLDEVAAQSAGTNKKLQQEIEEKAKKESWFQWFEFTPYETFCEEFGAGIPSYALGRPFKNGHNELLETGVGLPEIRIPLMMGIWGSAFCATLAHYYKEIRPIASQILGFSSLDPLIEEKNEDLGKIHPIDPAMIPNFVYGMKGQLPESCPESVFKSDHLQLMDAGMSNNLPIYPLLRPGRNVDVLVVFDASADVRQENWLSVVDGYARQRGITAWPIGAGWPEKKSVSPAETAQAHDEARASSSQQAAIKSAKDREERRKKKLSEQEVDDERHANAGDSDLGYCTVWVGQSQERISGKEPPPSKRLLHLDAEDCKFHLMAPDAGLAVIYFPLVPNPKVEGVDPDKSEFMSTWNFVYTPGDIEKVVSLARANFEEGREQTKSTVRAVYERKKLMRLKDEQRIKVQAWKKKLHEHADHFR